MNIDLDPPVQMNAAFGALRWNRKDLTDHLKTAAIYASFAAAILSSAALAYHNSRRWLTITATVSLINLYALPKILHHSNAMVIHYALSINLAALSTLFLGGIGAATFSMNGTLMDALKIYQFSTALFCAFGITALLGYGFPLCRDAISKAYQFLSKADEWKESISNLQEQFHRMPEMGHGCLQANLWQNLVLQIALIKPECILSYWQFLFISNPDYVWSMAAAASESVTLEQFREMLTTFEEAAALADSQDEDLPDEIQENYLNRLKISMKSLKKGDLDEAVQELLSSGSKFMPRVLSNEQFLGLIDDEALDAADRLCQKFLDHIDDWSSHMQEYCGILETTILKLKQDVLQLEKEVQDLRKAEKSRSRKAKTNS